jgi:hypothetical protein
MLRTALAGLLLATALPSGAVAQAAADRDAVRRAALDYVEAFYEGDSTKLVRSVRPEFFKLGFYRPADAPRYAAPERMSWAQALDFVRRVRERKNFAPASAPKEVEVLDVMDQMAAAKVTAWWGSDYLLMAKYDGRWAIVEVLWQSSPRP